MKFLSIFILFLTFFISSCDKTNPIPDDKFVGTWELSGRGMFDGMQIQIEKKDNKFIGKIIKLNDNKFVKLLSDSGDSWISEIKRTSNYEFKLTEKKVGSELFSSYGLSSSQEYKVQFIDDNTIGLATENSDPKASTITYKRIK
jgi:hypothetical protein